MSEQDAADWGDPRMGGMEDDDLMLDEHGIYSGNAQRAAEAVRAWLVWHCCRVGFVIRVIFWDFLL